MKPVTVTKWTPFSSLCSWSNNTPSGAFLHFCHFVRGPQSFHFLPSYEGCNLYPTRGLLTHNSQFKMRSCVCGCVRVRHEIVSVSRLGRIRQCCQCSYGQAFPGSMFRSKLVTLVRCDYVCVCLPFPGKTTMAGRRGLLHQSPDVRGAALTIRPIQNNVSPHGQSLTFTIRLDQVPLLTNRNASTAGQL